MATQTPNLGLVQPARGEFTGTWDIPINGNSSIIDTAVGELQTDITDAQGSASSLAARLSISLDPLGNPLPSPEILAARVSTIYGTQTSLDARIEAVDTEVFTARQSLPMLRDAMAWGLSNHTSDSVVSAPPGFLSYTGANVYVNGSVTPVVSDINGYRQVVSTQISTTISGIAGTYYIYLQRNPAGQIVLDRTGAGQNTGTVTTDLSSNLTVLNDTTQNFISEDIEPGQLLQITSVGSQNLGTYVIAAVGYNSNPNNLQIIGNFVSAQAGLNYKIIDPVAPTVGFTATAPAGRFAPVSNQIFIGQAVFDGTNVTSIITYALQGHYEGFTGVTLIGGYYNLTIPHNIGYVPTGLKVYASQASDFSQVLERLSDGDMTTSTLLRSVITAQDDLNIYIKNPTNGVFYKSFAGITQTAGFLFVVVDR
jgi:hypothetical protein